MKNNLREKLLEALDSALIIHELRENLTNEELISVWHLYFPHKEIRSPEIINVRLGHLSHTETLRHLNANFDVDAKYCFYNDNAWTTFNDLRSPASGINFKDLAKAIKEDYKKYLESFDK